MNNIGQVSANVMEFAKQIHQMTTSPQAYALCGGSKLQVEIDKLANKLGVQIIGGGTNRNTYYVNDGYVLKVAYRATGRTDNVIELKNSQIARGSSVDATSRLALGIELIYNNDYLLLEEYIIPLNIYAMQLDLGKVDPNLVFDEKYNRMAYEFLCQNKDVYKTLVETLGKYYILDDATMDRFANLGIKATADGQIMLAFLDHGMFKVNPLGDHVPCDNCGGQGKYHFRVPEVAPEYERCQTDARYICSNCGNEVQPNHVSEVAWYLKNNMR